MIDWCDEEFFANRHNPFTSGREMAGRVIAKKGFERFTQIGLVPYYMASRMKKKDKSDSCPYNSVPLLSLSYAYKCSNQCEHIYSESELGKHVDSRIYITESRIESSSEKNLNQ